MTDKDDKIQTRQNGKGEKDSALWEQMTKDVTPLVKEDKKEGKNAAHKQRKKSVLLASEAKPPNVLPEHLPVKRHKSRDLDRRTSERLRKGQINLDARLDLHGMTQVQAHDALQVFIRNCYTRHYRCVLVITGKGTRRTQVDLIEDIKNASKGILRQRVPEWLYAPPLQDMVLKVQSAHKKDGGEGALYVLLRRQRAVKE